MHLTHLATLLVFTLPPALNAVASPTDKRIIEIIELGVREKFQTALELTDQLENDWRKHPMPHFFRASLLQSMMMDYETTRWEEIFFREITLSLALGDSILKSNPNDAQVLLYRGAALSYKGFQLARTHKYLAGIRTSLQGIETLERALAIDSSLTDAYLAIGSYQYWRSYLTRHFSWLPFFSDRRRQGIELIEKAYLHGSFSKWPALSNLGWIFIQEQRYSEAIRCAEEGVAAFPRSRFFLWLLAEALFKDQQHARAGEVYQTLLESVVAEEINNHYNEILLHLKLAHCFHAEQKREPSLYHARRVLEIVPDAEVEERTRDKKQAAAKLLRELEQ